MPRELGRTDARQQCSYESVRRCRSSRAYASLERAASSAQPACRDDNALTNAP
jgi:hypothetical protein